MRPLQNLDLDTIYCGDGTAGLRMLADGSVDLIVTSPPYDGILDYGGHLFFFEPMADEIGRVLAEGGVCCWHVRDQVIDGSESCTSAEQKIYFRDIGLCIHQTLVVAPRSAALGATVRHGTAPEYVFVISRGKPKTFHPRRDVENVFPGMRRSGFARLRPNGVYEESLSQRTAAFSTRNFVWSYVKGSFVTTDPIAREHPAPMHERLAEDLILTFSNPGDLVVDPMSGAATTAKMAWNHGRRYLGFEIDPDFHEVGCRRLEWCESEECGIRRDTKSGDP